MELLSLLLAALLGLAQPELLLGPKDPAASVTVPIDVKEGAIKPASLPPVSKARGADAPLVVIDPGHGGQDPGAISPHGGAREKFVTLQLARKVRDALVSTGRVRVALTRNDDSYLVLRDRYEIARRLKADLFISIHADAAPNRAANGASIYTLSEVASDREAAMLAARENEADTVGGVDLRVQDEDVNRILIDLAQRESLGVSAKFASLLYREASPTVPFRPVYHSFAAFVVLKAPDIPSILFEAGYLTHAEDLEYIRSPRGQEEIAIGMQRAIEAHFARRIASGRNAS
jgi:N-acetylmuramoyl-L-alanine amidase